MMDARQKEVYWRIVRDCLTGLFTFSEAEAFQAVGHLREALSQQENGYSDLIYHAEPFDVARDLAKQPGARLEEFQARYREIYQHAMGA
jgi:hypothetical protein